MNRKLMVLAVAATIFSGSSAYADGSFTDVPKGHWAYNAIEDLAQKGVLMGYTDGSFRGENPMSRNTMAILTAQMLANIEQFVKEEKDFGITKEDIQLLEDLSQEFKDELTKLGTSVNTINADLAKIKKDTKDLKNDIETFNKMSIDKVKVSGEFLLDFVSRHKSARQGNNRNYTSAEFDFIFDADIDKNVSAHVYWTAYNDQYGRTLGGGTNINDELYEAYIDIDDLANGCLRIGRDHYTHGHSFVIHDYIDSLQYDFEYRNLDVAFNIFYTRRPFSIFGINDDNNHQIWNLSIDTSLRGNDMYFGYYGQTYKDNVNAVAPANNDFKNAKCNIVELGAKGTVSEKSGIDYEVGFVVSQTKSDLYNAADGWKSAKENGLLQHYALNYSNETNNKYTFKVAYTTANEGYNGNISLNYRNSEYDIETTPFDDIARIMNDYTDNFANTKDLKFQLECNSTEDKHSLRLAYDLLDEQKDNISNDFIGQSGAYNICGYDKLDTNILTLEYRYRIAENTRLKLGYTMADNDSSIRNGEKVKDETMFWTEIYSKF